MEIPKFFYLNDFYIFPLSVLHFHHKKDENRKWHSHDFSEIVLITGGSAKHILNDRSCEISAGDVLLIHPGVVHAYEHESLELINVIYDHRRMIMPKLDIAEFPLFHKFFPPMPGQPEISSPEPLLHLKNTEFEEVRDLLLKLIGELRLNQPGRLFASMAHFMQFLHKLCIISKERKVFTADNDAVSRAVKYMNEHYAEKVRIDDVAAYARTSTRNLYRLFIPELNCTPKDYLIHLRINHAMNMLANTSLSISEIAYKCGFADGNYFSDKFHKITGVTPLKYRRDPHLAR